MAIRISLCKDFTRTQWELPLEGPRLLIAWRESPPVGPGHAEDAVPATVQALFCQCMTRDHEVAWLGAAPDPEAGNHLLTPGFLEWPNRILRHLAGRPQDAWLLRSADPQTVSHLFDAAGFSWDQRGQLVVLIPPLTVFNPRAAQLLAAIGTPQRDALEVLWPLGAAYCILPGVDGCVAGVFAPDWQATDIFSSSLEAAARASGVGLDECDEESLTG